MTANRSRYDGLSLSASAKRSEDGYSYVASNRQAAANNGGVVQWLVESGNKTIIVTNRTISTNGNELEYRAYAGPTVTDKGTLINSGPLNITQSLPSTVKLHEAPTVTDKGTPLVPSYMPGASGRGSTTIGNLYANEQENILPPNTTLLLEVKNDGVEDPAQVELYVVWSEVDDKAPFQS